MAKQFYYVVWNGRIPGIYTSWAECQDQIKGFPGAKFKKFKTRVLSEEAYAGDAKDYIQNKAKSLTLPIYSKIKPVSPSIAVDAACSGNPGQLEYRGVNIETETTQRIVSPN